MGRPRKQHPDAEVTAEPAPRGYRLSKKIIPPAPVVPPDFSWLEVLGVKEPRRREFLIAYEMHGNVNVAARHIKLNPFDVYKWRDEKDEKDAPTEDAKIFKLALQTCEENRVAALENEARRRAFAGSDILLIFMLKGARPNTYRDNAKVEHEYPGGAPGNVNIIQAAQGVHAPPIECRTPEQVERVMELAKKYGLMDRLFPSKVIEAQAAVVEAAPDVPKP